MWSKLPWLALAGAIGTLCRFGLGSLVQRLCGQSFPWGTLVVNSLGCFLFGFVWMFVETKSGRFALSLETRFILLTGFMGAFTTFSTFSFETAELLRESKWLLALTNIIGQNLLGVVLVFVGMAVGRMTG